MSRSPSKPLQHISPKYDNNNFNKEQLFNDVKIINIIYPYQLRHFRNDSWFCTSLFHCPWCERGLIISYIYMCMIRTVLLLAMQMVCFKFPWNTSETNASCQEFILLVLRLHVSLYCIIKVCLLPIELCWNVDGKSH